MWWRWTDIEAPAPAAWEVLIDLDRWPEWGPSVTGAHLDDGGRRLGPDATGWVETPLAASLRFRITEWEPGTAWGWRVAGIPATIHRVEPTDGGCRVGMAVPAWAPGYLLVVSTALPRIAALAAEG